MHTSRKTLLIVWILLIALALGLSGCKASARAQTPTRANAIHIYFFWGNGCPHCAEAEPFLTDLARRYTDVELLAYEVWNVPENQVLLKKMATAFGYQPQYVPTIFIGDQHWEGFNDTIKAEIETALQNCVNSGCPDRGAGIIPGVSTPAPATPTPSAQSTQPAASPTPQSYQPSMDEIIDLPLVGKVDLTGKSLWLSTLLISFVDGVNPCSIWVLTMLLAITLHTGSRKKVVLIGIVFLTVTAGVYALFISGLFTIFTVVRFAGWMQVLAAVVALIFGLVNIKDYFWYKEGISFTISEKKKPGILQRMRNLLDASQSFGGLIVSTIILALGVSLVEFSCTAGFPVLWTNILASQKVTPLAFILLLLLYMVIYQLDEMVIFFTAVFTLKSSRLEEKHGRILKLIGGMLMLTLAIVLLVNPALMNDLKSSLIIFAIALVATLLVLLIHRVILPRFGVKIETGKRNSKKK